MCGYVLPEKDNTYFNDKAKKNEYKDFSWEKFKSIFDAPIVEEEIEELPKVFKLHLIDDSSGKFSVEYKTTINIEQFILVLSECFGIEADYNYIDDSELLDEILEFLEEDSDEDFDSDED